jgi:hypothetical protein
MAETERHACKDCEGCGCDCSEECATPWPCPCADPEEAS